MIGGDFAKGKTGDAEGGQAVSSGVYRARLKTGGREHVVSAVLLR